MGDDGLPATGFKADAHDAAQRATPPFEFEQPARRAAMRRTVGVYERPARGAKLSLPLLAILILVTLISLVLSVRFLL